MVIRALEFVHIEETLGTVSRIGLNVKSQLAGNMFANNTPFPSNPILSKL
jgi:hypothetical protein